MCSMSHPEVNMKQATTALMFSLSGLLTGYINEFRLRGHVPAAEAAA